MPFESKAQRKYLFAKHPGVAEKFASETPKGAKLPDHKDKRKKQTDALKRMMNK